MLSLPRVDHGSTRITSIRSHLADSGTLLARVLIPPLHPTIANEYSWVESLPLSSCHWFGGHVQDFFLEFQDRCVVPSSMPSAQRRLPVPPDVAPVHHVRGELHQPAQYPRTRQDPGANAVLQRNHQCSVLACHKPHRALDDPVALTFSHWQFCGTVWLLSRRACAISLANASIAG